MPRIAKASPAATEAARLTFKIDELEKPKALDLALGEEFLTAMLASEDSPYRVVGEGKLTGKLEGVDGGAVLRAELKAQVATECARCLAPVTDTLTAPVVIRYVSPRELASRQHRDRGAEQGSPDGDKAATFDLGDLDEEPFDGQRLNLAPAVRENLLLALPLKEVCREDCKGLCPTCGQNLNEQPCECRPSVVDPRWARLQELKLKT